MLSLQTFFVIIFSSVSLFAQKTFEGKVSSTMDWKKAPLIAKPYLPTSSVTYYKKDKVRTETTAPNSFMIVIEDYTTGKRLTLVTLTGMLKQKSATIANLIPPESANFTIVKTEEYKTVNNYNCQKVVATSSVNGKESNVVTFVNNDFTVNAALLTSGPVYTGLPMEVILTDINGATGTTLVQEFTEEPVNDELFSLTIPEGYKVMETPVQTNIKPASTNTSAPVKKVEAPVIEKKYTNVSDADLKKILDAALAKEDFETAQAIKDEMDARKKTSAGKYAAYSTPELTKMLNDAVSKEDFTAAQEIKKELDSRK